MALPAERQQQQNVQKVKGLNAASWIRLIDLIHKLQNTTPIEDLREIILNDRSNDRQDAEIIAIRSNITTVVRLIHDPSSQMMDKLFESLRKGKLCVVDISQMRGQNGLILSGIVLQQIFEHNQRQFTEANPDSIPTIAVLEEAQSVLGGSGGSDSPYVAWVKEGRKYGLGAVLITQQPGSISDEILSQGDNWFIFHLLSSGDLQAVKRANAHFSNDLLSSLLNEPIPGNGIFWSSSGGKPYPISVRVLSFENLYPLIDKDYNKPAATTFGAELIDKFEKQLKEVRKDVGELEHQTSETLSMEVATEEDVLELYIKSAFKKVKDRQDIIGKIKGGDAHWMLVQSAIEDALPSTLEERNRIAYDNTSRFMNEEFGNGNWKTVRRPGKSDPNKSVAYFELTGNN